MPVSVVASAVVASAVVVLRRRRRLSPSPPAIVADAVAVFGGGMPPGVGLRQALRRIPRRPQDGSRWPPRWPPRLSKMAPRRLKMAPRRSQVTSIGCLQGFMFSVVVIEAGQGAALSGDSDSVANRPGNSVPGSGGAPHSGGRRPPGRRSRRALRGAWQDHCGGAMMCLHGYGRPFGPCLCPCEVQAHTRFTRSRKSKL